MKTLLVPTDFSEVSNNSIEYAVELAKSMKSKIILFHVYHMPVITTEAIIVLPATQELENDALEALKKIKKNIQSIHGKEIDIECKCVEGFADVEISSFSESNKIDMIVIGMHGAGYVTEKLVGSITTSLIRQSKCPVLAIDEKVKFKAPSKVVLASDYLNTENKTVLQPLKYLIKVFRSHLYVLNVIREAEPVEPISKTLTEFISLEDSLADVDHTLHYLNDEKIVDGINAFVDENKMDMVVMIPRKHTFLKSIFQESNTKRMAFHSSVPLLALH